MWHAIVGFLLRLHAQGLSHEAVIEIMIALLGVMLTVLGLLIALLGLLIALFGFFGYTAIRDEAIRRAVESAASAAKKASDEALKRAAHGSDAAGYAESQREIPSRKRSVGAKEEQSGSVGQPKSTVKRRATSDSNLTRDDEQ